LFISSTSLSLTLYLGISYETGGSDIINHKLYFTDGTTDFAELLTYDETN